MSDEYGRAPGGPTIREQLELALFPPGMAQYCRPAMERGRLRTWFVATDSLRTRPGPVPPAAEGRGRPPPPSHPCHLFPAALVLGPLLLVLATPWLGGHRTAGAQGASSLGADEAEQTYLADCASCHGAEGRGTNRGPTLVGVGEASTYYYLSTGRMPVLHPDSKMTRSDPAYPPELVEALVEYVDEVAGGGPDTPELHPESAEVARGGRLYRAQCASCHTTAGGGGALLRQEAPSVYHATPAETASAIRVGPGTMPAFAETALSDDELNDLVAYVDYLASPEDRGGQSLWHLGPLIEGLVAWVVGLGVLVLLGLWIGKPT